MNKIEEQYQNWVKKATEDPDVVAELKQMALDEEKKKDFFIFL